MLKELLKKCIPGPVLNLYHYALARLAAFIYGHPSEELIVIGITGTNGKSTTVNYLGQILESAGKTVGWTSTASFKVGKKEWENDKKMTMLGRFQTQKLLREMVQAGCTHAIVETSSQGISQYRHIGINYDIAAITNLTPEHIEAHGGFENYKKAKGKLFSHTKAGKRKTFSVNHVEKSAIVNLDDEHADYFASFKLDKTFGFSVKGVSKRGEIEKVFAKEITLDTTGSRFSVGGMKVHLRALGEFNVKNALASITIARALGLDWGAIKNGVDAIRPVPGRLELIDHGQPFTVIVDYAYEPAALKAVYDSLAVLKPKRILHVLGSAGGGRDISRREILGAMAAEHDALAIVTNEDPYDEDPMQIIDDVADAALESGMKDDETLFRILDRQEAIDFAIESAEKDDLVLITGKGSEPVMAVENGKKIPWDDRTAVKQALKKHGYAHA